MQDVEPELARGLWESSAAVDMSIPGSPVLPRAPGSGTTWGLGALGALLAGLSVGRRALGLPRVSNSALGSSF